MTFGELFAEYIERHAKRHKRTWREDEAKFTLHLSSLAKHKLSQITREHVAQIHGRLSKVHPVTANRVLALVSSVFGRAREWGMLDKPNPCEGIRRNRERSRDRFLQSDELPRFFRALAEEPNSTIRDYLMISLLTGARRGNVLAMRWEHLNFERRDWQIPETKNGSPQTIPLGTEALTILTARKPDECDLTASRFVFPGSGRTGHLVWPAAGWRRVLKRAEINNLRPHDLRRTLGSWQASTGASLVVIGKTLNHKSVSTTAIYARLNLNPVRQAVELATSAMLRAGRVGPRADTGLGGGSE